MKKALLFCRITAVFVIIIAFTPVAMPSGEYLSLPGGIPYSLFTGILVAVALVVLTKIETNIFKQIEKEEQQ